MLSKEENELITRTGPGTPLGQLMRRYWIPAALCSELPEPDCPPIRITLLGEKLVAFRDTYGRIGLLDEFCAHRRASLFLGRNEESGLRCVYHGWKYDIDGNCVDMPNEPAESNFKNKIHLTAYPTIELGGVIWAYLGVKEKKPPEPRFEWTQVPESHRTVSKTWQECNWLQALEGSIDTAHFPFLHRSIGDGQRRTVTRKMQVRTIPPKEDVDTTDYGFVYASVRSLGEEGSYVRMLHYVMPFHEYFPNQLGDNFEHKNPIVRGHMFVPMDDENCMVYNWAYTFGNEPLEEAMDLEIRAGRSHDEQTADFRKVRNKDNDWLINRDIQKTRTYTGIEGINTQDHAVQESMGPIVDRTQEHLGSTDRAIIIARRLLLQSISSVQQGEDPPGVGRSYYNIRAIEALLPRGIGWRDAFKEMFHREQQYGTAVSAAEV